MRKSFFSSSQTIGAIIVCILIIITFVCLRYMPRWQTNCVPDTSFAATPEQAQAFQQQLQERRKPLYLSTDVAPRDTIRLCMQPFNPNTADSLTLRQLGIPSTIVHNILRYRAANGVFRTPQSLRRIYGMTDTLFSHLRPYIQLDTMPSRIDTLPQRYLSLKKDTILDLNTCDTTELKYIRGIGSVSARQIVRYRRQLGGFVSVEQLREIPVLRNNVDTLMSSFVVSSDAVQRLSVNHTRVETLSRHPYINFEQAKAIYEHRRMQFRLHSIDDLRSLPVFTDSLLLRLEPYLSFED